MDVLVVDDDADVLRSFGVQLRRRGYEVATASGVQETRSIAVSLAGGLRCALIDYCLADGDGVDVLSVLRDAGSGCGAVLMTGVAPDEASAKAKTTAFDDYLTKPVEPVDFDRAVREGMALGDRRSRWGTDDREVEPLPPLVPADNLIDWGTDLLQWFGGLTPGEREILRRDLLGQSAQEIAATLGKSSETVKSQRTSIHRRLRIRGRYEYVAAIDRAREDLRKRGGR